MEIQLLKNKPDNWDALIKTYDTKTLFHETAWLDHMQSIHPKGKVLYYQILDKGECIGYFCAFQIYKTIVKILGSPLGGTGTNFLGPIVNYDTDQTSLVSAIRNLVLNSRLTHLEIAHEWLDSNIMQQAGFEIHADVTHMCEIPDNEEAAWGLLKSSCRNRVRKAEKNGLVIELTTDQSLADEYYEQFIEVYAKQGMVTPFGIERPRSLLKNLGPADRIFGIRITNGEDVVATGLFPYDEHCVYFWGAASWLKYHKLCPNELLHWTVIETSY